VAAVSEIMTRAMKKQKLARSASKLAECHRVAGGEKFCLEDFDPYERHDATTSREHRFREAVVDGVLGKSRMYVQLSPFRAQRSRSTV
jgi:hypothetical protein